jgi:hypothetical protein
MLVLTIKKKWFDMILSGEKKEEYREINPYWRKRINPGYEFVHFRNGYNKSSPYMSVELKSVLIGLGIIEWGAPERKNVIILKLGKVIYHKP